MEGFFMKITQTEIIAIIQIIKSIRQLKAMRLTAIDFKDIESIELGLHYFINELNKHNTEVVACIEDEINRGLSAALIIRLYRTETKIPNDIASINKNPIMPKRR